MSVGAADGDWKELRWQKRQKGSPRWNEAGLVAPHSLLGGIASSQPVEATLAILTGVSLCWPRGLHRSQTQLRYTVKRDVSIRMSLSASHRHYSHNFALDGHPYIL